MGGYRCPDCGGLQVSAPPGIGFYHYDWCPRSKEK